MAKLVELHEIIFKMAKMARSHMVKLVELYEMCYKIARFSLHPWQNV
jgi:hypothetical protein